MDEGAQDAARQGYRVDAVALGTEERAYCPRVLVGRVGGRCSEDLLLSERDPLDDGTWAVIPFAELTEPTFQRLRDHYPGRIVVAELIEAGQACNALRR